VFTGIVHHQGTIASIDRATGRVEVDAPTVEPQKLGDSVAIDGCCLTVVEHAGERIAFELIPETFAHTTFATRAAGDAVNVEPALRIGEPLGGHWVQGHVDATGTVARVEANANALDIDIDVPEEVARYCIDRGSITIDGVSLTVMRLAAGTVGVQLIPETQARTTLGGYEPGRAVNLEADVLAKYVAGLLRSGALGTPAAP
jgi:riboflavin synthase